MPRPQHGHQAEDWPPCRHVQLPFRRPNPKLSDFPFGTHLPEGGDGSRGGNKRCLAFIFSQTSVWQMVAQLSLPFSLIAPHPGCSWKQRSSLFAPKGFGSGHAWLVRCRWRLHTAALTSARVLLLQLALLCVLWVPSPVVLGWAFLLGSSYATSCLPSPSDRSNWLADGVCWLVQIISPRATGQETPPQPPTVKC